MSSHRRVPCQIALGLFALASCVPTGARAASDAILIYGPQSATTAELEQANALLSGTVDAEAMPASSIHVLDLPFSSADPVWIAGDSRVVPCSDPAFEAEDIPALVAEAVDHIDALDYEAAKRLTDRAITALPCAPGAVERSVLIDVYYFRGIAAFHLGDRDGAQQNFQYALAIDREKTWDTNYPPEPQQVFLLAKEDAIGLDRVPLGIDLAGGQVDEFNFDAVAHPPAESHELSVIPGMHLVQYSAGGSAYSRLVEVRQGGSAALVTRQGLTAAVVQGPTSSGMLPAARASLRALVQGRNLKRAYVVVVAEDGTGRIYLYDETYTTLAESATVAPDPGDDPGGDARRPLADGESPGGLTLGIAGFALAHGSPYAGFNLRGHVRLVKGLELDLGAGVNATRYTDDDGVRWGVGLPYVRLGVRYQFGTKRARPYVGGAFLLSIYDATREYGEGDGVDPQAAPGGVGLFGIDLFVATKVAINVELAVGYSRHFWLAPQFGIAFRF